MVKRLFTAIVLLIACVSPAFGLGKINIRADYSGMQASVAGFRSGTFHPRTYPGATVSVYLASTSTLATLYADSALTAKANPFTAASNGDASFYAADGDYDITFVCTAPNCTTEPGRTWTESGKRISGGSSNYVYATDYGTITYGTSATAPQQTANAASIQAGVTAAVAQDKALMLPCGTVLVNAEITSLVPLKLSGCGTGETHMLQTGANKNLFVFGNPNSMIYGGWQVNDVHLATADGSLDAIWLRNVQVVVLRDILITGAGRNGIRLTDVQEIKAYNVNNEVAGPVITGQNARFGDDRLGATALLGTLSVTNGSNAVVGVGTAFVDELSVNDWIAYQGSERQILAITDQTHLTFTSNWSSATLSGITMTRAALTGTFTFTSGSPNVTGVGTKFNVQIQVGDILRADGYDVRVLTVGGAGTLTLDANWPGATFSGAATIEPYPLAGNLTFTLYNPANPDLLHAKRVTGVGTAFTSLQPGAILRAKGVEVVVGRIINDTELYLASNWPDAAFTGAVVREREGAGWQLDGTTTTVAFYGCSTNGIPYGVRSVAAGGLALIWTGTAQSMFQRALRHTGTGHAVIDVALYMDTDANNTGELGGGIYLLNGRYSRIHAINGDAGGVVLRQSMSVEVFGNLNTIDIDATSRRCYIHDVQGIGGIASVGGGYFKNLSPDSRIERVRGTSANVTYGTTDSKSLVSLYPARGFERWNGTATPNGFFIHGGAVVTKESGAGNVHSGTYSAKVVSTSTQDGLRFSLEPIANFVSKSVTVRGWYKTTGTAIIFFSFNPSESNPVLMGTGGAWAPFEMTLDIPATTLASFFVLSGTTGSTIYYDDVDIFVDGVAVPTSVTKAGDTPNISYASSIYVPHIKLANAAVTTVILMQGCYGGMQYIVEIVDANTILQDNVNIVLRANASKSGAGMMIPMICDSDNNIWYQTGYESQP